MLIRVISSSSSSISVTVKLLRIRSGFEERVSTTLPRARFQARAMSATLRPCFEAISSSSGSSLSVPWASGLQASVAVLLFVILLVLSAVQLRGFERRVHYGS